MTEEEAREQVRSLVSDSAVERLHRFAELVSAENERQNLIARSTVETMWVRHMLDSVQLIPLAPADGTWLDIGTGGGFPGLAIAIATPRPMILIEPRRRRAEFLQHAIRSLELDDVAVRQCKVEDVDDVKAAIISARAVAPIDRLIRASSHCAARETCWILPRGASYGMDVEEAEATSSMMFHVEHSLTDPTAAVVVATRRGMR